MEVARLAILIDFVIVLSFFVAGAMLSAFLINRRAHLGAQPLYPVPLVIVVLATTSVAITGHLGVLGDFGGAVDEAGDFVLLSVLSFASGLQNAAVATSTGLLVRTTHLTGPSTDLGIHLVEMTYLDGEPGRNARRHARLRAGKLVAFGLGAATGITLAHRLEFLAYLVPAAVVAIATVRSFLPEPRRPRDTDVPPQPGEPLASAP